MQMFEAAGSDFFVSSQGSEHRESTVLSGFKDFIQVGKAVLCGYQFMGEMLIDFMTSLS